MAEKVIVKSASSDLDGAQFENAATEATLKRLVDLVEKQKPGSGGSITQAAQKSKDQGISPSVAKQTTEAFSDIGSATKKASSSIGSMALDFTKFLASGPIAALSTAFIFTKDTILKSMDALRETGPVGASFNGSLLELNKAAASSGMNLQEYSAFVRENSQTMAMLGGTATEGAKRMGILSKELRSSEVGEQMMALGYTSKDLNSGLADYIQNEALRGRLQGKSDAELRKGAGEYVKQMSELSRLTGESAEALQKKMNDELRDARVQALMAGMTDEQQKAFQDRLAMFNSVSPELGNAFKDLAAGIADNDTANELKRLNPELASMIEGIRNGVIPSNEAFQKQLMKTRDLNEKSIKDFGEMRGAIVNANEGIRGMAKIQAGLNSAMERNQQAAKEEGTKYGQFTKVVMNAGNMLSEFYGDIKKSFLDSKIFTYAADGVSWLSGKFLEFKGPVTDLIKSVLNGTNPVFEKLSSILNTVAVPAFNFVSDIVKNYVVPAFNTVITAIKNSFEPTLNFLGKAFNIATDIVKNYVVPGFNGLISIVKSVSGLIGAVLMPVISEATRVFNIITSVLGTVLKPVIDLVGSAFNSLFGGVSNGLTPAVGKVTGTIDNLSSIVKTTMPYLISLGEAFVIVKGAMWAWQGVLAAGTAISTAWNAATSSGILATMRQTAAMIGASLAAAGFSAPVLLAIAGITALIVTFKSLYDSGWNFGNVIEAVGDNLSRFGIYLMEVVDKVMGALPSMMGGYSDAMVKEKAALRKSQKDELDAKEKARDEKRAELRKERGTEDSAFNFSAKESKTDKEPKTDEAAAELKKLNPELAKMVESLGKGAIPSQADLQNQIKASQPDVSKINDDLLKAFKEKSNNNLSSEALIALMKESQASEAKDKNQVLADLNKNFLSGNITQQQMIDAIQQMAKRDTGKKDIELPPELKESLLQARQGKMSNDEIQKLLDKQPQQLAQAFKDKLVNFDTSKLSKTDAEALTVTKKQEELFAQLKTPAAPTPQPPRDYNDVRWKAEEEASKRGLSGKIAEEAGDRAVAQAKADDAAREAAANQVATLNTVSDGIGKLSGIMMSIYDLQLQQVEAQKDLVNAAKGRYNVTT